MVNNYIKSLAGEGLISVNGETNRTKRYHLTPCGRDELRKSLISYSAEIVQLFGAVKREIAQILNKWYQDGIRTLALFGAAETAEVVYAAIQETPLVVIGIVDSDETKQGKPFNGLMVRPPEQLLIIKPDAILITSFGRQEEIFDCVCRLFSNDVCVKRLSEI